MPSSVDKSDKQDHHFSSVCHFNLEGRGCLTVVDRIRGGCLKVGKDGWAPGADRHKTGHNDVVLKAGGLYNNLISPLIVSQNLIFDPKI